VTPFAEIPPSVAAFHLAFGPGGYLYVAAPTLSSHDVLYRVAPDGTVEIVASGFGRPQGLAFDSSGMLYVVDAIAGDAAVFRMSPDRPDDRERVLSGGALIGLAFDPLGGAVIASGDTAYRIEAGVQPLFG
jgi:sugar lactone lactonase YvrE